MQKAELKNTKTLVHIGCHKTASSWLQKAIFDNAQHGFCALSLPSVEQKRSTQRLKSVSNQILFRNRGRQFLGPLESPQKTFLEAFSGQNFSTDLTYVLSDERLSGNPHSGGFDRVTNCLKLKEALPSTKIFMVFRAQETMIRSCYHQYIVAGGSLSLADYMRMEYNSIVPSFSLDYFFYDKLLQLYQEHFGAQNVLALPYELFLQSPDVFLRKIKRFAGSNAESDAVDFETKINNRPNPWLLVKFRILNRLARQVEFFNIASNRTSFSHSLSRAPIIKYIKPRSLLDAQKKRETAFIASEIQGFYKESNRTLEILAGVSLKQFGYML